MTQQSVDLSRTWSLLNGHLREGEKGHCHTVAGYLLRPEWTTRDLAAATQSGTRDALFFGNERVLAVTPREAKPMGVFRALRAARGDLNAFGDVREIPRDQVTGFEISGDAPLQDTQIQVLFEGDFKWLTVQIASGDELRMLLDEVATPQPQLDEKLDRYLGGEQL